MIEHDLSESVEQARHELQALRARLEHEETAPGPPEIRSALDHLLEILEKLQDHRRLLRETVARTSEAVFAEERLRQSLAAELHDGLSQDIALVKMKLSALRASSSADLHDPLTRLEHLVGQADRSLRSITYQLSPPSLHDLGLVPALQWLAEDISSRYDLDVRHEGEGTAAVADDRTRVILFRAVRELLINTAMHAGVRVAIVVLGSEEGMLHITVEDEGVGFDIEEVGLAGYGLFGIREQLRYVGGSMHVDSAIGRGTTVTLTAPLATGRAAST